MADEKPTPGAPVYLVTPDGYALMPTPPSVFDIDMSEDVEFEVPVIIRPGATGTLKYKPWGHSNAIDRIHTDPVTAGLEFKTLVRYVFSTDNGSTGLTSAEALHNRMGGSPVKETPA